MPKFIVRRSVPILDEHVLRDEDGQPSMTIGAKKLEEIARKNNDRVAKTGDLTPIVIGHTKDDAPEHQQPELVGYAMNFRVQPLFKTGKKAIHADFKFFADKAPLVKNYPRRSVELWLSDWKIDPIALLGATTPERDLGLLQLSAGGRRFIRRYMQDTQMPMPPAPASPNATGASSSPQPGQQDLVAEILAALDQTDVFQWAKAKMAEEQQMDQMGPVPLGPEAGLDPMMDQGPMPPEVPDQGFDGEDDYEDDEDDYDDEEDEDDEEDDDDERPVRRSAVASVPSGSNTFLPRGPRQMSRPTQPPMRQTQNRVPPQGGSGTAPARTPLDRERAQPYPPRGGSGVRPQRYAQRDTRDRIQLMARAQLAERAKYARAFHAMASEFDDLRLKYARSEREKDLIQLEAEGVLFDRVEELDTVMGMDDEQYARHVNGMRKNYQRAPLGRLSFSAESIRVAKPKGEEGASKADMDRITDYALAHGLTYNEAREKLLGE